MTKDSMDTMEKRFDYEFINSTPRKTYSLVPVVGEEIKEFIREEIKKAHQSEREKTLKEVEDRFYGANDPKVKDILELLKSRKDSLK